jgi:glycosyltransferase involved in cell wall biosynthesis
VKILSSQGKMHMDSFSISIVIPAYNEEKTIEEILLRTNKTMENIGFPYEIIVVDDGSTDKTRLLAERHKTTILNYGANKGKGYALKTGIQKATGNIIVTMDADGSHKPEEITKLLKPLLNGADIVAGSRFIGKQENGSAKKLHIFGNHIFNLLILLLTRKQITDSQTGFRALKKTVIQEIEITSEGYQIETELTVKTLRNGYIIQEEPITCEKRKNGCSHLNPLNDGFKILKTIVKTSLTM